MRTFPILLALSLASTAAMTGCERDEPAHVAPADTSDVPHAAAVVETYDDMRLMLSKGDTSKLSAKAVAMAAEARLAAERASGEKQSRFEKMADASKQFAKKTGDLEAMRGAFGEVSRALIDVLATEEELREGRRIYACPHAEGHGKWVQQGGVMENPYTGEDDCGELVEWSDD